jgi:hypothetical protein
VALKHRQVKERLGLVPERLPLHIARNTHDFDRPDAGATSYVETFPEDVLSRPVLPGHGIVDDDHR